MARLAVRQNGSCPADAQWYVCAAGGFKGCCSVDPCTTGVCPDESGSSGSTRSSSSSSSVDSVPATKDGPVTLTTLVQEPATSRLSTSFTSSSSSTPISSSETSTEAPSSVRSTSTASRASSTTMATTTSSTPNQDPTTTLSSTTSTHSSQSTATQASLATSQGSGTWHPTAALIGGTVAGAVGLLLIIILLVFCVQRARKRRHQTFILLRWRSGHNSKPEPPNGTSPRPPPTARTIRRSAYPLPKYTHHTHTHKYKHSHSHTPSLPPFTFPDSAPSYPYKKNRAAELSDTGFYRPRAELLAQSSRELINIPAERRCRWDCDGGDGASDMVVTADGAVLRATIKTVEADSPFAVYDDAARTTTRDEGPPRYSGIEYGMSGGCRVWEDDKNRI
ncbi:hypothetical protein AnigIFM50267_001370 [Aspergillus niger]|nr:hypothetical protein AnigIFM50267_001370 [Aspergillus niger]